MWDTNERCAAGDYISSNDAFEPVRENISTIMTQPYAHFPMDHCEATLSFRLSGGPDAVKYRGSRLPNHYVMCRAASSGAGDSAESCWGEFLLISPFYTPLQTFV